MKKNVYASLALALFGLCSVEVMAAVVGGGSTLAEKLYRTPGVLGAGFNPYVGVGSGNGKLAVLNNDASKIYQTGTVDYAGSDSVLTAAELMAYKNAHQSPAVPATSPANWGPLIQIPSAITSVVVPYKKVGVTALNLTSAQLCKVFDGTFKKWYEINPSFGNTEITVVYRAGSSGTSEIFTRHLNSQCGTVFGTSSTFTSALKKTLPANFVAASSSIDVVARVNAKDGSIGYVGPEGIDVTNNAVVARVNGNLPMAGKVATALGSTPPPAIADRADPAKWVPDLAAPATGYSIVGYTNFVFSQCYKDVADTTAIKALLNRHYGSTVNNDAAIIAKNLIPLTSEWKQAVRSTFWTPTRALAIGNASACNGIGRPL